MLLSALGWLRPLQPSQRVLHVGAAVASGSQQSMLGPSLVRVDAALYPLHSQTKQWIVFSDLHCSVQTLDVCQEVLAIVQEEAQVRDAGIIFLGDFWHIRGALRVEVLNNIMAELGKWTRPVIMIPGNHDQVTQDGQVHALTPLGFAIGSATATAGLRQTIIITVPTIFLDALWLPYARDTSGTRAILQSIQETRPDDVDAVFLHADIRGAAMNDNIISKRGLQLSLFPKHLPSYVGHFHKPHQVTPSITYIGSPYQTSLNEAHQQKRLLFLTRSESKNRKSIQSLWQQAESIPLDVGRRFFRTKSSNEAEDLLQCGQLRPGDRIVLTVRRGDERRVEELRKRLRDGASVDLEVREALDEMMEGVFGRDGSEEVDYEALGTEAVWQAYMDEKGERLEAEMLMEGLRMMQGWENEHGPEARAHMGSTRLELHQVRLSTYGPYRDTVEYPVSGRGLVLLRGKNLDDPAAESNAAGKSKLAMAGLWALTGEAEQKPVSDRRAGQVTCDLDSRQMEQRVAEVSVAGCVNDQPFEIVRRRGTKLSQLSFVLDGQAKTRQGVKETQKVIAETLGLDLDFLSLCIFCSQHQLHGFLEASDVRLKERLSGVVRLDIWQRLTELAKVKVKKSQEKAASLDRQIAVDELDLQRQQNEEVRLQERLKVESSEQAPRAKDRSLQVVEEDLARLGQELNQARIAWEQAMGRRIQAAQGLAESERLEDLRSGVRTIERQIADVASRWDLSEVWKQLKVYNLVTAALPERLKFGEAPTVKREAWIAKIRSAESSYQKVLASEDVTASELTEIQEKLTVWTRGEDDLQGAACPTCGRAWDEGMSKDMFVKHIVEEQSRLKCQLKEVCQKRISVEAHLTGVKEAAEAHKEYLEDVETHHRLANELATRIAEVNKRMSLHSPPGAEQTQTEQSEDSAQKLAAKESLFRDLQAAYNEKQQDLPRVLQEEAHLKARDAALIDVKQQLKTRRVEIRRLVTRIERTKTHRSEQDEVTRVQRQLTEAFGVRGVQAFILRAAVAQLEGLSNQFLSYLSEAGLRLRLTLDGERIVKEMEVRDSQGEFHDRPLAQLSGGQWRRASLACLLGFRELARLRARMDCNLLVLDEVLDHLDGPGRARVGRLLKSMSCIKPRQGGPVDDVTQAAGIGHRDFGGIDTIILILQDLAAYEMEDSFDFVDEVVKRGDVSTVVVDTGDSMPMHRNPRQSPEATATPDHTSSPAELFSAKAPVAAPRRVTRRKKKGSTKGDIETERQEHDTDDTEATRSETELSAEADKTAEMPADDSQENLEMSADQAAQNWLDGLEEAKL